MIKYIGVKFSKQGQIYYFYTEFVSPEIGDQVLVSTEEGLELAKVIVARDYPPSYLKKEEIKPIERIATAEDVQIQKENNNLAVEAFAFCQKSIKYLDLSMKLVDVEVRFDRSKIVFYFTAPTRIDFRELVKILVGQYRTRIELRQIGVRHEAQILGGIGNCGRICCCHLFLRKFDPVTIKMAKEQQLFLNPSKISGACGRLLCCLNFEKEAYEDVRRRCPKVGKKYQTSLGELKILQANLFRNSLIVGTNSGEEREISLIEWADIVYGKENISSYGSLFYQNEDETEVSSEIVEQEEKFETLVVEQDSQFYTKKENVQKFQVMSLSKKTKSNTQNQKNRGNSLVNKGSKKVKKSK